MGGEPNSSKSPGASKEALPSVRPVILSRAGSPRSGESAESKDLAAGCAMRNRKGIPAMLSAGLRCKNFLTRFWSYQALRGPSTTATLASRTPPPLSMTMDSRETRLARNETLFREVNERIEDAVGRLGRQDAHVYKCSNSDCTSR